MLEAHVKGIQRLQVGKVRGSTKQGIQHLSANDCCHAQNLCRRGAESLQPAGQQVERRTLERNLIAEELPAALAPPKAARLPQGPYDLLRKEGVSHRQAMDGIDNCSIDRAIVQQTHHEHLALATIEAPQLHLVYPLLSMERTNEPS
jgi:hypothetical protein